MRCDKIILMVRWIPLISLFLHAYPHFLAYSHDNQRMTGLGNADARRRTKRDMWESTMDCTKAMELMVEDTGCDSIIGGKLRRTGVSA
ncbi:hypothetical protein HOY80DRAFT_947495 [Tuber brumale]|nr:hypothetical protein HOY80DRAFT_947495 [Tuber brumale]